MKSVDRPLCGRIGQIGWSGLSGRERSGDRVLTISSNSKSNSNYKVKKRKKKIQSTTTNFQIWTNGLEVSPNPKRIALDLVRSHQIRRDLFQIWWDLFKIWWDLSRSGEISLDWWDLAWRYSVRSSRSCGARWRRFSWRGDRDSVSLTVKEREREREQLRVRPCGRVGNG